MTLCIAWIRKQGRKEELCIASDSCLSGGERFWAAPKVFALSRGDSAFACAGDAGYFYPVAAHILQSIDINQPIKDRSYDFSEIIHYFVDIINKSLLEVHETMDEEPDFTILLGGYSWCQEKFIIKELRYNRYEKKFFANSVNTVMSSPIGVIGDLKSKEVRHEIYKKLEEKGVKDLCNINMEPFEVLMKYINDKNYTTIGGYPQMIKVYPFMRVLPWGFIHTKENGTRFITYYGRPLLEYETFPYPMYDLQSGEVKYMKGIYTDFERHNERAKPLEMFRKRH